MLFDLLFAWGRGVIAHNIDDHSQSQDPLWLQHPIRSFLICQELYGSEPVFREAVDKCAALLDSELPKALLQAPMACCTERGNSGQTRRIRQAILGRRTLGFGWGWIMVCNILVAPFWSEVCGGFIFSKASCADKALNLC